MLFLILRFIDLVVLIFGLNVYDWRGRLCLGSDVEGFYCYSCDVIFIIFIGVLLVRISFMVMFNGGVCVCVCVRRECRINMKRDLVSI